MRTIYLDEEFKCHVRKSSDTYLTVETDYFDGKDDYFVESYVYIPGGEYGNTIYKWRDDSPVNPAGVNETLCVAELNVEGAKVHINWQRPFASGEVGSILSAKFDNHWTGLNIFVSFIAGDERFDEQVTNPEAIVIPERILMLPYKMFEVGFCGYSAKQEKLTTAMITLGRIPRGAMCNGESPADPRHSRFEELEMHLGDISGLKTHCKDSFVCAMNEVMDKSNAQYAEEVSKWLDAHPEATTTVQDMSLGSEKMQPNFLVGIKNAYMTPQMFGARADGVTDDTAAVQGALNKASVNGGVVYFPEGVYLISQPLLWHSFTAIIGSGSKSSTIKLKAGSNCNVIESYSINHHEPPVSDSDVHKNKNSALIGCSISDIQIDGGRLNPDTQAIENTQGHGLFIDPYGFKSQNVIVRNIAQVGVYVIHGEAMSDWHNDAHSNDTTINSDWQFQIFGTGEEGAIFKGLADTTCNQLIVQFAFQNGVKSSTYSDHLGAVVMDGEQGSRGTFNLGDVHIAGTRAYGIVFRGWVRVKANLLMIDGCAGGVYYASRPIYSQINSMDLHNINGSGYYLGFIQGAYTQIGSMEIRQEENYETLGLVLNDSVQCSSIVYFHISDKVKFIGPCAVTFYGGDLSVNLQMYKVSSVDGTGVKLSSEFYRSEVRIDMVGCAFKQYMSLGSGMKFNHIDVSFYGESVTNANKNSIIDNRDISDFTWNRNELSLIVYDYTRVKFKYPCEWYFGESVAIDPNKEGYQTITMPNPFLVYTPVAKRGITPIHNDDIALDYITVSSWSEDQIEVACQVGKNNVGYAPKPVWVRTFNNTN